jgi:beta-glucanase (GH16 family)
LVIEARKESFGGREYTSTRLISKDKGTFTYGRVEVRAKLPSGRGTWPAIWMLANKQVYGNTYWPDNGEIDIMEHVGFDPNVVHFSIHTNALNWTKQTQQTAKTNVPTALTDFHVYRLDWTPVGLKGYVDNRLYFDFPNGRGGWQVWPFDQPFFMLLNIAVGGNWGGQQGVDDSVFPQRLEVDYVRVYKLVEKRK